MLKTGEETITANSPKVVPYPVADPGFSPGGVPTPQVGVRTYFFGRKLHENERILAPRGGARPWRQPLDPPLIWYIQTERS